jgi:hypothetical protein
MLGLGRQFYASLNTGLFGELEHLKIKTRLRLNLIDEKFGNVMGECVI